MTAIPGRCLALCLALAACGGGGGDSNGCGLRLCAAPVTSPAAISDVTVSPTNATLLIGQTATLTPTARTANGNVAVQYTYASATPSIATVTADGMVTGVSAGTTTVTITARGSGTGVVETSLTTSATITVARPPDALQSVSLTPANATLTVAQSQPLVPTPSAAGTGVAIVYQYTSSAPAVAVVTAASGVVTAVAPGNATITVTATGSGQGFSTNSKSAIASITVTPGIDALQGVTLTPPSATLTVGQQQPLTPTPATAGSGVAVTYLYASGAPGVASVGATSGVVTAIAPGTATITVTATGSGPGFVTSSRTATSTIAVSSVSQALGVGFGLEQFANIAAGTYSRGSTTGGEDEKPVRAISISAFRMQRTEVTQAQWRQVMTGTTKANPSGNAGCDACPVEGVSWDDAQTFLTRLNAQDPGKGYRLPTEAEWEYAARAGTTGDYNVAGQAIEALGWISTNSQGITHPVAQKLANAWGLYDVHGNVAEWVNDGFASDYYATSPATDPQGPANAGAKVLRGGSWNKTAFYARSSTRFFDPQYNPFFYYGFRIARAP